MIIYGRIICKLQNKHESEIIEYNEILKYLDKKFGNDFYLIEDINKLIIKLYKFRYLSIIKSECLGKVIIINPNYPYENIFSEPSPPLGVLLIGTFLSEHNYDVKIIDMQLLHIDGDGVIPLIKGYAPDYICISLNFSMCHNNVIYLTNMVRKYICKTTPIIVGGNHVTFTAEEFLQNSSADIVVKHHALPTILHTIDALREYGLNKNELLKQANIVFKHSNEIYNTKSVNNLFCINDMPLLNWRLINPYLYSEDERWALNTSVGCTNSCHYCSTSRFNGAAKMNFMSAENIINQIKNIKQYAIEQDKLYLTFVDDAFAFDSDRIVLLCKELINQKINIKWGCLSRVDHLNYNLIELMKDAGCESIFFGIESCNKNVLAKANKKISIEDAKDIFKFCKAKGIYTTASFIVGLPEEDESCAELISSFIDDAKPNKININILRLYPGTQYWQNPEKHGLTIIDDSFDEIETFSPMIETQKLNKEKLLEIFVELKIRYN